MKKLIVFPSYNVTLAEACCIVKDLQNCGSIANESIAIAIEKVARMETHNSITKDDLVQALRWLFDHYDFG